MEEKISALHSQYVIDGSAWELSPSRILDEVTEPRGRVPRGADVWDVVVDESIDPGLDISDFSAADVRDCLSSLKEADGSIPLPFAGPCTRGRIASALIGCIWRMGHFTLDNLGIGASWKWNPCGMGHMAAFYSSVQNAAEYVDSLGLSFFSYSYQDVSGSCRLDLDVDVLMNSAVEDGKGIRMASGSISSSFRPDPKSWIVYIPFETSEYRLGGSLLARSVGKTGGVAPQVEDPDYFIDCYEVVRELVEDGIVLSGATVGEGGLMYALDSMTSRRCGASVSLNELSRSQSEPDIVRLLFAEVPGVVIQISDYDFDYLDAELLLQDVAYFPIGHPAPGKCGVELESSGKSGIQTILESLILSQGGEGED